MRMRIYEITADCLVDFCLLHWYVKAKNEREAWLKGYGIVMNCHVADIGTVDCKRISAGEIPVGSKIQ